MSIAGRMAGVFHSPGDTFADVARRPDFIAPLVAGVMTAVAVTESMLAKIGMENILRMSVQQSKRSPMSPEQMEQAAKWGGMITHITGFVAVPVVLLIVAGVGLLIVNTIFGARTNFKTAFSVTCYANLVSLIGGAMGLAMIFLGDPEHFNVQNPIPSNIGFFLNPLETSKPLVSLASSVDIFTLWFMALLGIGFSAAMERKVKAGVIFASFFGVWLVWVLAKAGLAMLG
jgi:hypothetical protein